MQDSMYAVSVAMAVLAQITLITIERVLTARFPVINPINGVADTQTQILASTEVR